MFSNVGIFIPVVLVILFVTESDSDKTSERKPKIIRDKFLDSELMLVSLLSNLCLISKLGVTYST